MSLYPDPVWPVLVLALISAGDAVLCVRPVAFIADCLRSVRFPERYWWIFPPIKAAAAAGLVAGIWVPLLGTVTAVALVVYFVLALAFHVRARDFGLYFVSAVGMFVICCAVLALSFVG